MPEQPPEIVIDAVAVALKDSRSMGLVQQVLAVVGALQSLPDHVLNELFPLGHECEWEACPVCVRAERCPVCSNHRKIAS